MAHYPQSAAIAAFFTQGQPMAFGAGNVILGNEDVPNGVYFINSGFLKIYSISNEGDEYIHIIYGQGEIFPLAWAYLGQNDNSLFYEALSDIVVWRVARDVFIEKLSRDFNFTSAVSLQLANQLKIYANRVNNLEYKKADERIAYRLLSLASRFGVRDQDTIVIEAPITHAVFANSINLVRESVSREIEKLVKARIIRQEKHRIVIIDLPALENKISSPIDLGF